MQINIDPHINQDHLRKTLSVGGYRLETRGDGSVYMVRHLVFVLHTAPPRKQAAGGGQVIPLRRTVQHTPDTTPPSAA